MKYAMLLLLPVTLAQAQPVITNGVYSCVTTMTVSERSVLQLESPQPNGVEKKQVFEIYQDRVLETKCPGETILTTNSVDTGRAVIKLVPMDPRRFH